MTEVNTDIDWLASLINYDDLSEDDQRRARAIKKLNKSVKVPVTYYGVAAWGIEGLECFLISSNLEEVSSRVNRIGLRARYNSHRGIHVYAFASDRRVDYDMVERSAEFRKLVEEKGHKIH